MVLHIPPCVYCMLVFSLPWTFDLPFPPSNVYPHNIRLQSFLPHLALGTVRNVFQDLWCSSIQYSISPIFSIIPFHLLSCLPLTVPSSPSRSSYSSLHVLALLHCCSHLCVPGSHVTQCQNLSIVSAPNRGGWAEELRCTSSQVPPNITWPAGFACPRPHAPSSSRAPSPSCSTAPSPSTPRSQAYSVVLCVSRYSLSYYYYHLCCYCNYLIEF